MAGISIEKVYRDIEVRDYVWYKANLGVIVSEDVVVIIRDRGFYVVGDGINSLGSLAVRFIVDGVVNTSNNIFYRNVPEKVFPYFDGTNYWVSMNNSLGVDLRTPTSNLTLSVGEMRMYTAILHQDVVADAIRITKQNTIDVGNIEFGLYKYDIVSKTATLVVSKVFRFHSDSGTSAVGNYTILFSSSVNLAAGLYVFAWANPAGNVGSLLITAVNTAGWGLVGPDAKSFPWFDSVVAVGAGYTLPSSLVWTPTANRAFGNNEATPNYVLRCTQIL